MHFATQRTFLLSYNVASLAGTKLSLNATTNGLGQFMVKLFSVQAHGVVEDKSSFTSFAIGSAGNTKEGSITVTLTSCLTGLQSAV